MRVLLAAGIVALLIQPANSQLKPTFKTGGDKEVDPRVEQYRKNVEQEHKSALEKIPDKETKKKTDPWSDVRDSKPSVKR